MFQTRIIAAATASLNRVQQQIQEEMGGPGKLQITTSVLADLDVAGRLLAEADPSLCLPDHQLGGLGGVVLVIVLCRKRQSM